MARRISSNRSCGRPFGAATVIATALALVATAAAADTHELHPDDEEPTAADQPPAADEPEVVDIDALRREYLELRDRLFRSRARAHTVASALYSTELRVHLDFPRDRFVSPTRAVIRLNGATIFEDGEGAIAADRAPRFEGYIAPGPHTITIRVEAASRDDARFETASEHTFSVVAPRGQRLTIRAVAADGGDIGYRWGRSQSGSHKLHLDVAIEAEDRDTATGGGDGA
jgi:hypothetical protein